ncbi:MAG: ABC transporter permease [Acidobacteriaceae bacterium]
MATIAATTPRAVRVATPGIVIPSLSLWQREIVRFYRQRARVIGVIISPLLFWVAFGAGFAHSFTPGGSGTAVSGAGHSFAYFFPGSVVMIVLFTAIFSMMSLIQDRNEGFLLSVLASPVSRSAIVLGKVLGGATLAAIQGILFLVFSPIAGVHASFGGILLAIAVILMISFELTALGFTIAWPMDSTQAFHAIVNLVLIPLWLLSGALFPASGASGWLHWIMLANPLTYGVDALRDALFPGGHTEFGLPVNLAVTVAFCLVTFAASWAIVNRRTNKPAA